jgi:hypothetical protein
MIISFFCFDLWPFSLFSRIITVVVKRKFPARMQDEREGAERPQGSSLLYTASLCWLHGVFGKKGLFELIP